MIPRLAIFTSLAMLAGCGRALGPEAMPTTSVNGRIHASGRPIGKGWLEFVPVDGTIGNFRSAAIQPDGSFHADKVPVGTVAIRIEGPRPSPTGDPSLDAFLQRFHRQCWMRRRIAPGPTSSIDLDLRAEYETFLQRNIAGG